MSLQTAMNTGASGLDAESDALGVVGDNISNMDTIGFKESRAIFEDVLGSAVGGGGAGLGVSVSGTQQIFAEGSLESTGNPTDLAISGDGFFVVNGTVDGVAGNYYTRAGETSLSNNGTLVNPQGLAFQGYQASPTGTGFTATVGNVTVPPSVSATGTTTASWVANLSSDPSINTPVIPATPIPTTSAAAAAAASSFQLPAVTVYDSRGQAHTMTTYLQNNGGGNWSYETVVPGGDTVGGTAGALTVVTSGTLTFNTSGALTGTTGTTPTTPVTFSGAAAQTITLNFGTPSPAGSTDGLTDTASANNPISTNQNGYASGDLSGVSIDSQGVVSGVYTNGQTTAVAQIAMAKFVANNGLSRAGQGLWSATTASGAAAVADAGEGGRGSLVTGALEQSNVDITQQFVELIGHQQAFSANSKTVTTADQMLSDLMNLIQ